MLAGYCVESGSFTLTSLTGGGFDQSGPNEFITTNATYTGVLTDFPSMLPAGTISLTGTIEQQVLGRASSSEAGTWTTDLVSMALTGPLGAHTLDLGLNPGQTSSGTTSIASDGGGGYIVNSYFDVFAELTL